jgi:hypothetical protein
MNTIRKALYDSAVITTLVVVILGVGLSFNGCTQFQQRTPDERARILLDGLTDELTYLFDGAEAYVANNPDWQQQYQAVVLPAFDLALSAVEDATELAKKGEITPEMARAKVMPYVSKVIWLLYEIGYERGGETE